MRQKNYFYLLVLISACSVGETVVCTELNLDAITFQTKLTAVDIQNYQHHDFKYRQNESDTSILLFDNYNSFVHRLNLKDNSYSLIYELNTDFIESPTGFYYHNKDSVFFTLEMHKLVLANQESEIIKSWDLSQVKTTWEGFYDEVPKFGFSKLSGIPNSILGFNSKTENIHISFIHFDIWYEENDRTEVATLLNYNIETKESVNYGKFPLYYNLKNRYSNFLTTIPFAEIKGDTTLLTFPMSEEIMIFDNKLGKLLDKKCFFLDELKISEPFTEAEFSDYDKRFEQLKDKSFYGQLHYHSTAKLFSRPVYFESNNSGVNNNSNFLLLKPFSIMLFSADLDPIKLIVPDKNDYATPIFDHYIPTTSGYLLKEKKYNNENLLNYNRILSF